MTDTQSLISKILVGYDGSRESRDALHLGRSLAQANDADLLLACVFPYHERGMGKEAFERALREDGQRIFASASAEFDDPNVQTFALGDQPAAEAINDLAVEQDADLVVVGSTNRGGFGRVLPGSTAQRLLSEAPCPVAVAPRGFADSSFDAPPRVIAVAFDGSIESQAALRLAVELAIRQAATIRIITVNPPMHPNAYVAIDPSVARESYQRSLHRAVAGIPRELRALPQMFDGAPAAVIHDQTELGVDLLVMGSHGRGPLGRAVLGSVSSKVLATVACPVLMVPPGAAFAGEREESELVAESAS